MSEITNLKRFLRYHAANYPLASAVITTQVLVGFIVLAIQIGVLIGSEQ